MPDLLELSTLGGLELRVGAVRVSGLGSKAAALLVYLACTGRAHSREALAELLWNERESAQARSNLRVVLSRLPQVLSAHLSVTRETVAFDPAAPFQLDLADFERHLHAAWEPGRAPGPLPPGAVAHLQAAAALYRGPFLQGFYLPGAREFESWMLSEQDRLGRQVTTALRSLVAAHLERGEYDAGVGQATRLLELDPLDEEAHRQLMRLLAAQGQRGTALRQYELYRRRLSEDLGVEPDAQTAALAQHIRAGEVEAALSVPGAAPLPGPAVSPPDTPLPPTPFVGREADLAELRARLADPASRLVTVVGPGGSGKTRLALEAVRHLTPPLPGGVFFIPLVAVADAAGVVGAVARAVGRTPSGGDQAQAALLGWLRGREVLLLLDGFEHLSAAAALLTDLLRAAPGLRLLVTSREPLHLHAEWLFDLGGMPLPETDSAADLADSAAVRLFVQSARRAQARFALGEANAPEVVRICRLVDGSPLGIELAAAWVRVQDCATIAREIGRDLDFLTSPLRDVPERHHSMRAVFEHSWGLLPQAEREGLRRLSVFRGSFEAEAAREVSEVNSRMLAALVDRSLLGRGGGTRYELHELLRQFAGEKLAAFPDEEADRRARYVAYYERVAGDLRRRTELMFSDAWKLDEREGANLRAALELEWAGDRPEHEAHASSGPDAYPIRVEASVMIARALEDVFAFAADVKNDPEWLRYSGTVHCRYTTGGAIGVGTGVERTTLLLGRRVKQNAVTVEYLPNRRVCHRSTSGPIRHRSWRIFETVGRGTRLTCINELDIRGWYRITAAIFTRVAQRVIELDLESLKTLLEAGRAEAGGAEASGEVVPLRTQR